MKAAHLLVLALAAVIVCPARSAPSPIQDGSSDQGLAGESAAPAGPVEGQMGDAAGVTSPEGATTQDTEQMQEAAGNKETSREGEEFFEEEQPESKEGNQSNSGDETQATLREPPQATSKDAPTTIAEEPANQTEAPTDSPEKPATPTEASSTVPTVDVTQTTTSEPSTSSEEAPRTTPAEAPPISTAEQGTNVEEKPTTNSATTNETPVTTPESETASAEAPTSQNEAPTSQNGAPPNQFEAPTSQAEAPISQAEVPTSRAGVSDTPAVDSQSTAASESPSTTTEKPEAVTGAGPSIEADEPQIDNSPAQEVVPEASQNATNVEEQLAPIDSSRAPDDSNSAIQPAGLEQSPQQLNQTVESPNPPDPSKGADKPQLITGPLLTGEVTPQEASPEASPKASDGQNVDQSHGSNTIDTAGDRTKDDDGEQHQQKRYGQYKLNMSSCTRYANESVLNSLVETILDKLSSEECLQMSRGNLRLRPSVNKQISSFIMESSSSPFDIGTLTQAQMSYVSCEANPADNSSEQSSSAGQFRLRFKQELEDGYLVSRWRLYKRLSQDDLPSEVFRSLGSMRGRSSELQYSAPTTAKASNKCQRFGVDSGDYYLQLLEPRTSSIFEINLDKRPQTGSGVRLVEFELNQLYLDHSLVLTKLGATGSTLGDEFMRRQQTTQIFHDNNNHYRRNHWLLELYANWLKHEYRNQLRRLVRDDHLLVGQMNVCLSGSDHKLGGPSAGPV